MRKFEVTSQYINDGINIPKRATTNSAGYDFESAEDIIIKAGEIKLVPTGIKAIFPRDEVLLIYCRSSLPYKRELSLPNGVGVIDADYYNNIDNEGAIFVQLRNFGNSNQLIKKGERIAQGIFSKYHLTDDDADTSNKRIGGFGSSGK